MTDSYHMGFKDGQQSLIDQGYVKAKHGYWTTKIVAKNFDGEMFNVEYEVCSVCGHNIPRNEWKCFWYSDFCPSCGAVMDGAEEND